MINLGQRSIKECSIARLFRILQTSFIYFFCEATPMSKLSSSSVVNSSTKTVILFRHGITEMNEYFDDHRWGSHGFKDPELWDTVLSVKGRHGAQDLNSRLLTGDTRGSILELQMELGNIDLMVSSPLTRALQTCEIVFKGTHPYQSSRVPKMALSLAAERLYLSSDVGRIRPELEKDFPHWDFSALSAPGRPSDTKWWYTPEYDPDISTGSDGEYCYQEWRPAGKYACLGEPDTAFRRRMCLLREWLVLRPEKTILLVCHWGVIRALTGDDARNCGHIIRNVDELHEQPFIDSD